MNDVKFITHLQNDFTDRRISHNAEMLQPLQVYLLPVLKSLKGKGDIWP